MTLEKHSSDFDISCDFCPYHEDTREDDFHVALEKIKGEGWQIIKVGDGWEHKCPGCVQAEMEDGFGDV